MTHRRPSGTELAAARALLGVGADATATEISAAWRRCVRLTHPDAANAAERAAAEARAASVNSARDMLLRDLDTNRPAVRSDAAADTSEERGRRPHPPQTGTPRAYGHNSGRTDDERAGRGIMAGLVVFMAGAALLLILVLVGVAATGSRSDNADRPSITQAPATTAASSETGSPHPPVTDPTAVNGVALSAPTPELAAQHLLFALSSGSFETFQGILAPDARPDDLRGIVDALTDARNPSGELKAASLTVDCRQTPGLPDRAVCTLERPRGLLGRPLEFDKIDDNWRLAGWG